MKQFLSNLMPLLFKIFANAQQLQLMLSLGHLNDVYSPDGKYIVTTVNDNTTKVWRGLI